MRSTHRLWHVRRRIRSRENWNAHHVRRWKHHTSDARLWRDAPAPKSRSIRAWRRAFNRMNRPWLANVTFGDCLKDNGKAE